MAGVILEKNFTVGDIVDTTHDMFKIADLSRLGVMANVYEEDLPKLVALALSSGSGRSSYWPSQALSRGKDSSSRSAMCSIRCSTRRSSKVGWTIPTAVADWSIRHGDG